MSAQNVTLASIGSRLRQLRTERGLSVRTLAARAGFSPSFISQAESEAVSPSIASLERIIGELGSTLGQFFSSLESTPRRVVRRDERQTYESAWSLSTVEVLTDAAPGRKLSAVQVTVEPGGVSGKRATFSAQEMIGLVLSGELTVVFEDATEDLRAGDSFYITEGVSFSWKNLGTENATFLMAGTPGRTDATSSLLTEESEVTQRRQEREA